MWFLKKANFIISSITFAEYLSHSDFKEEQIEKEIQYLKSKFIILDLDEQALLHAAYYRRNHLRRDQTKEEKDLRKGMSDFFIAGTALATGKKILTFDKRFLKLFSGLTETMEELIDIIPD